MPACLSLMRPALAAAVLALNPWGAQASTTLYDPSLGTPPSAQGTPPSAQGWLPLAVGSLASQGVAGGVYALDTTGAGVSIWGNSRVSPVLLGACRIWGVEAKFGPSEDSFCRICRPIA